MLRASSTAFVISVESQLSLEFSGIIDLMSTAIVVLHEVMLYWLCPAPALSNRLATSSSCFRRAESNGIVS